MGFFSKLFGRSDRAESGDAGENRLVRAALEGNAALAREALAEGIDPDENGGHEIVPLILALVKQHGDVAELLISAGADVNRADPRGGMTALHASAMHGMTAHVESLLAKGARPDPTFGSPPVTPFTLALRRGHQEAMALLLEAGADPDQPITQANDGPDMAGTRAIAYAASVGDVEMIKLLAKHRANLNILKDDGLTPMMSAAFVGQLESVKALAEAGANPNLIHAGDPANAFTALDLASLKGHREIVDYLRERKAVSVKDRT